MFVFCFNCFIHYFGMANSVSRVHCPFSKTVLHYVWIVQVDLSDVSSSAEPWSVISVLLGVSVCGLVCLCVVMYLSLCLL